MISCFLSIQYCFLKNKSHFNHAGQLKLVCTQSFFLDDSYILITFFQLNQKKSCCLVFFPNFPYCFETLFCRRKSFTKRLEKLEQFGGISKNDELIHLRVSHSIFTYIVQMMNSTATFCNQSVVLISHGKGKYVICHMTSFISIPTCSGTHNMPKYLVVEFWVL